MKGSSSKGRGLGLALLACAPLFGCSTRLPPAGVAAYERCDFGRAAGIFKQKADKADKDQVMYRLAQLSSALRGGDGAGIEASSQSALDVMWSYAGQGRGAASLASAEAIKIYKGEPFEKSMAAIYAGIHYFNRGDFDNARAAFNKALLATALKQESARQDFALAHFLLAKTEFRLGNDDNAKIALGKAAKIYPENGNLFDPVAVKAANAIFLFELGTVPTKTRSGPGNSQILWIRPYYPERGATVEADGRPVGRPVEILDLTAQAQSKGRSGKDAVQATKGVARDVSIVTAIVAADAASRGNETAGWVALGAGLFALANQSQADTRQWEFLPDLVLAAGAKFPPGPHRFAVQFIGPGGGTLAHLAQDWEYTVPEAGDSIFVVPASRCKINPRIGDAQ